MGDPPLAESEVQQVLQCVIDFFLHHRMHHFLQAFIECKDQQVTHAFSKALTADSGLLLKFVLHQACVDVEILRSLPPEENVPVRGEVVEALQRVQQDAPEIALPAGKDWKDFAEAVEALKAAPTLQEAAALLQRLDDWLRSVLDALSPPRLDQVTRWMAVRDACLRRPAAPPALRRRLFLPQRAAGEGCSEIEAAAPAQSPPGGHQSRPDPIPGPAATDGEGTPEAGRTLRKRTLHHSSVDLDVEEESPQPPRRRPWTAEEDRLLRAAVRRHGAGHWADICRSEVVLQRRGQVAVKDRWRVLSAP
eukprot:EG_transcript_18820